MIGNGQPTTDQSEPKEREDRPRWRGGNGHGAGYRCEQDRRPGNSGYWMAWVDDPSDSQFDSAPPDGFDEPPPDDHAVGDEAADTALATSSQEQEATYSTK